jgi:hypothetical protein
MLHERTELIYVQASDINTYKFDQTLISTGGKLLIKKILLWISLTIEVQFCVCVCVCALRLKARTLHIVGKRFATEWHSSPEVEQNIFHASICSLNFANYVLIIFNDY